jgi:hypothetical protein
LQSIGDQGRALGNLFGLGDRFAAGMDSLGSVRSAPMSIQEADQIYNKNLANEQQQTAAAMNKLGPIGTGEAAVGDSLGAAAALPEALAGGGMGLGGRLLGGATGGATIGAIGGAAETPAGASWQDMGKNAAVQGLAGGVTGGIVSPALSAGGELVNRALATNAAKSVLGMPSAAVKYASGILGDGSAVQPALDNLGPQSTLADVSPEWLAVARGAAANPGTREDIVNAMNARSAGANQRLGADLNASLGPVTPPSQIAGEINANRQATGQLYDPLFQNATAVNTQPLANQLDTSAVNLRGPAQDAVQGVRNSLNITGTDQLDPNPGTLFQTRQSIDGQLRTATDPKVIAQLSNARQQVDAELQRAVPGIKPIDSQYAQIMGQNEGLQTGANVLDSGKTAIRPEDFAQQFQQAAQPTGQMVGPSAIPLRIQQGNRAEIDRVLGTNANDPAAFNRLVKGDGDWNPQKLSTIYGPDNAQAALAAGQREATFADTANRVTRGSDTAMGTNFSDAVKALSAPTEFPKDITLLGTGGYVAKKAFDMLRGNNAEAAAQNFIGSLGSASVAQGSPRDQLVQALMQHNAAMQAPLSPGAAKVVNALAGTREDAAQRYLPLYGAPSR